MQIQVWQLIVGTIAGFITAFFAEPIRMYLSGLVARKQLREAPYREMGTLCVKWKDFIDAIGSGQASPEQLMANLPQLNLTDCYQYAKTRPVEYYALREATTLEILYRNYLLIGSDVLTFPQERVEFAKMATRVFENTLRERA